jgi:ribosome maturation factor RimP
LTGRISFGSGGRPDIDREELFRALEPAAQSAGLDLVEVSLEHRGRRSVVKLVVHGAQGVSLGDCEKVTRNAEDLVEGGSLISGSYVLEVSSPGLDRVLKSEREFDLFRGRKMRIRLQENPEREIVGWSEGTREGHHVALRGDNGDVSVLSWSSVARASLDPNWGFRSPREGKES